MTWIIRLLALTACCAAQPPEDISNLLEPIRQKHDVPAIAAAVITPDGIVAHGVAGVRKKGEKEKAVLTDLWHLGSETKAITATLAGTFVADGSLKWEDTVTKHFPEFANRIDPALKEVTIADLLAHRAGLTPNLPWAEFNRRNLPRERRDAAKTLLTRPPANPVGSYEYSNAGYVVVGAVLEKLGKKPWEELLRDRIFKPLAMPHAGFGGTGTPGKTDQPWPHLASGKPVADNGPAADNPPILGPAGTCHASLASWSAFLSDQLRGASGAKALLPPEIYRTIQTAHPAHPADTGYGLGWGIGRRPWAGGKVLTHTGSNTMNFAVCWLALPKKFGVLVCINQAGDDAQQAADETATALISWHEK